MASSVVEQIIAMVFARAEMDGVTKMVGRRCNDHNAGPNTVVAIPVGAPELSLPNQPGDKKYSDKGRQLLLRWFNVEWWCHGYRGDSDALDFARAEELYIATITAIRQTLHHSVSFANERWFDQEDGNDSYERFGSVIVFTSTIQIPIYEARSPIVSLTATPKIATTVTLNDNDTETIEQP